MRKGAAKKKGKREGRARATKLLLTSANRFFSLEKEYLA